MKCPLCNKNGFILYSSLSDKIFHTSGSWQMYQCSDNNCKYLWLDIINNNENIQKSYEKYYTHLKPFNKNTILSNLTNNIKYAYWANKYKYRGSRLSILIKIFSYIVYIFPMIKRKYDTRIMFLESKNNALLLDIGSGNGEFMSLMNKFGWMSEGIDIDPYVVNICNNNNLKVQLGTIININIPNGYYDAITLNSVIEHIANQYEFLKECYRILKPGGKICIITPNSESICHKIFKNNWRGLEPPRHLGIFNITNLKNIINSSGFKIDTYGTMVQSNYIIKSSFIQRKEMREYTNNNKIKITWLNYWTNIFSYFQSILSIINKKNGEEIYFVAYK